MAALQDARDHVFIVASEAERRRRLIRVAQFGGYVSLASVLLTVPFPDSVWQSLLTLGFAVTGAAFLGAAVSEYRQGERAWMEFLAMGVMVWAMVASLRFAWPGWVFGLIAVVACVVLGVQLWSSNRFIKETQAELRKRFGSPDR